MFQGTDAESEGYRTIHFRDDKTGKVYSDLLEIQILELRKLPADLTSGEDVVNWMRFFSGKSREEFENMSESNEYLKEAYNTLVELSADEEKRLEYEAREKALRDYNSQMNSAIKRGEMIGEERGIRIGEECGIKIGEEFGEERTKRIFKLYLQGESPEEIAKICQLPLERVKEILE